MDLHSAGTYTGNLKRMKMRFLLLALSKTGYLLPDLELDPHLFNSQPKVGSGSERFSFGSKTLHIFSPQF
jgi:hypothetical protein